MIRLLCTSFVICVIGSGCWDPDPRDARGALDLAARALEAGAPAQVFKVVDERARHAMISIVKDRHEAAALVRSTYPPNEQAAALQALGDAVDAVDAADLFARRCDAPCLAALRASIGAPVEEHVRGDEVEIRTAQGGTLRMHVGSDSWWGIVWRTEALSRERDRAAQDLRQIRDNAAVYQRRRALEVSAESVVGSAAQDGSSAPER